MSALLRFTDNCLNTIRTIPLMVFDTVNPEDINTDVEDHAAEFVALFAGRVWIEFVAESLGD